MHSRVSRPAGTPVYIGAMPGRGATGGVTRAGKRGAPKDDGEDTSKGSKRPRIVESPAVLLPQAVPEPTHQRYDIRYGSTPPISLPHPPSCRLSSKPKPTTGCLPAMPSQMRSPRRHLSCEHAPRQCHPPPCDRHFSTHIFIGHGFPPYPLIL